MDLKLEINRLRRELYKIDTDTANKIRLKSKIYNQKHKEEQKIYKHQWYLKHKNKLKED